MRIREVARAYRLAQWTERITARSSSGESIKAYCERTGVCENTYYYWQRKLREAACAEMQRATDSPLFGNESRRKGTENGLPDEDIIPTDGRLKLKDERRNNGVNPMNDRSGSLLPPGWTVCTLTEEDEHNGRKHKEKTIPVPIPIQIGKCTLTASAETDMTVLAQVCQILVTLC